MDSNQILAADSRVTQLMNVGNIGAGYFTGGTLATGLVTESTLIVVNEDRFPHQTFLNPNHPMRAIMIVDRSFLTRSPTNDEHFD